MNSTIKKTFVFILLIFISTSYSQTKEILNNTYMGEKHPNLTPKIFAPGTVTTDMVERDFTISPDGKQIYYSLGVSLGHSSKTVIILVEQVNGKWSKPKVASFSGR